MMPCMVKLTRERAKPVPLAQLMDLDLEQVQHLEVLVTFMEEALLVEAMQAQDQMQEVALQVVLPLRQTIRVLLIFLEQICM